LKNTATQSDLNIAIRLAERIISITAADITAEAMDWSTIAVLDTIGVSLAGASEPCVKLLLDVPGVATAPGPALILGTARRTSMLDAALVNGTAAHALDYDDVCGMSGAHPSAPMVPSLLALAEAHNLSGKDLLISVMVGIDIQNRIGRCVNVFHYVKGWHPTSTLGIFGTVAASARLLKLDLQQTTMALGIAASCAAGIKANFGTMTKPLHAGHSARGGLLAALLAQKGYTSNSAAFEHTQGFLEVFNGPGKYAVENIFTDWSTPINVEPSLGIKQFPCCGSTHPAVTMMLALVKEEGVTPADAVKIEILAQRNRLPHTNNPHPLNGMQARFSIQYAVARALVDGVVRLEHFEGDAHLNPHVRSVMQKIITCEHPDMPPELNQFGSEVIVTTRDGRRLARRIDHMMSRSPENPMRHNELKEKFVDCAKRAFSVEKSKVLFDQLIGLASVSDFNQVSRSMEVQNNV